MRLSSAWVAATFSSLGYYCGPGCIHFVNTDLLLGCPERTGYLVLPTGRGTPAIGPVLDPREDSIPLRQEQCSSSPILWLALEYLGTGIEDAKLPVAGNPDPDGSRARWIGWPVSN